MRAMILASRLNVVHERPLTSQWPYMTKEKSRIDLIFHRVCRRAVRWRGVEGRDPCERLPLAERVGVLVGLLDSQQARNGMNAWIYNGYYLDYNAAIIRAVLFVPSEHTGALVQLLVDVSEIGDRIEATGEWPSAASRNRLIDGLVWRRWRRQGRY